MTVTIESGNRIQLPAEWVEALGLKGAVCLDRTEAGILVRAVPLYSWDEIFANKLQMGKATAEEVERTGDDLLY
jgi:hypothetical protein